MLILNSGFKMPADGWCQLAPMGEFRHAGAGVIQVIDAEACVAMAARFAADAAAPNFAGLLIDFDHFSMQGGQRSEAAGWITGLEARVPGSGCLVLGLGEEPTPGPSQEGSQNGVCQDGSKGDGAAGGRRPTQEAGLWAQIRWSDAQAERPR